MKNEKRKNKNDNVMAEKGRSVYSLVFFFLISSFLFFTGCPDPFTANNAINIATNIPADKGSFSLTFSQGRTILPTTPSLNDFAVYNLAFTPTSGGSAVSVDRTNTTLSTEQILLMPGIYNLTVNAYKDSGKNQLMARGTLDGIEIKAGQNTTKSVKLEALLTGGTGTFSWNITVPQGVTTASMVVAPANAGGTAEQTVTLHPSNYTGSRPLNSGQYNLTFNLEGPSGRIVWKELLYVYQNIDSNFTFTFTSAHFGGFYTVTYDSNGGSNVGQQSVLYGGTVSVPTAPTRNGYYLEGWYKEQALTNKWNFVTDIVTQDITLYAKWELIPPPVNRTITNTSEWNQALTAVRGGGNGTAIVPLSYIFNISGSFDVSGLSGIASTGFGSVTNIIVTLKGSGTISLSSLGSIVYVGSGQCLVINSENLILQGRSDNNAAVLTAQNSGSIELKSGTISGNTSLSSGDSYGGGVYVNSGSFTMSGGEISNNNIRSTSTSQSSYSGGGGVCVIGGSFTMLGGKISSNTTTFASYFTSGGGVYVSGSSFTMSGGEISNNTTPSVSGSEGGGVCVIGGSFTMSGGKISNNTSYNGGGVYVGGGSFTMNDGEISNNTATAYNGGGVGFSGARFTMNDGKISGNSYEEVYATGAVTYITINGGEIGNGRVIVTATGFTMNGGEISAVSFYGGSTFTMSGGSVSYAYMGDSSTINLSGNPIIIGTLAISNYPITLTGAFTGGITGLNLYGNNSYWLNKVVVKGSGYTLTTADVTRFNNVLGVFTTNGTTGQAIKPDYILSTIPSELGILIAN